MLNWNDYQYLVLAELAISLVAWLLIAGLLQDPGLKLATGMIILSLSGVTAIALRRMTGY